MKEEDKFLLLQDLCARLPYKVVIEYNNDGCSSTRELGLGSLHDFMCDNAECKPYLRPMSSMTEEECIELGNLGAIIDGVFNIIPNVPYSIEVVSPKQFDWLNKKMFDYRALIPMSLALEAPEGMYNLKEK